jgi:hypothetical protein
LANAISEDAVSYGRLCIANFTGRTLNRQQTRPFTCYFESGFGSKLFVDHVRVTIANITAGLLILKYNFPAIIENGPEHSKWVSHLKGAMIHATNTSTQFLWVLIALFMMVCFWLASSWLRIARLLALGTSDVIDPEIPPDLFWEPYRRAR